MKQKRLIGIALASILVLSGCSASAVKEDDKYVIASIDGKNILADDMYETLSSTALGKSTLYSYILDELIKTNFPVTSDMKENASQIVSNIETSYQTQYGDEADDYLESALAQAGYDTMDKYKESLISSLQYSEFIKKYVKDNFDEVFDDYYTQEAPRFISMIQVAMTDVENPTDDESAKLEEVKSLLQTDKDFASIATDYSDDANTNTKKGSLGVIDSTSGLSSTYGSDVETAALSLENGKVSDAIKGESGYYFLYCSGNDKDTIKKELKTVDVDSPLLVYDEYITYLAFNTYKITYKDETIEKEIKTIIDEALAKRTEARGGNS